MQHFPMPQPPCLAPEHFLAPDTSLTLAASRPKLPASPPVVRWTSHAPSYLPCSTRHHGFHCRGAAVEQNGSNRVPVGVTTPNRRGLPSVVAGTRVRRGRESYDFLPLGRERRLRPACRRPCAGKSRPDRCGSLPRDTGCEGGNEDDPDCHHR